jgi:hypothetical protein
VVSVDPFMCRWLPLLVALVVVSETNCRRGPAPAREISALPVSVDRGEPSLLRPSLYADEEAAALVAPAKTVVPVGKTLPKRDVLRTLQVDPRRLRDYRVIRSNLSQIVIYQLSETFDLTWATAEQDPMPIDSDDRQVFGVRVQPRTPVSQDLEAVGLLSNQPLQPDGASPRR